MDESTEKLFYAHYCLHQCLYAGGVRVVAPDFIGETLPQVLRDPKEPKETQEQHSLPPRGKAGGLRNYFSGLLKGKLCIIAAYTTFARFRR